MHIYVNDSRYGCSFDLEISLPDHLHKSKSVLAALSRRAINNIFELLHGVVRAPVNTNNLLKVYICPLNDESLGFFICNSNIIYIEEDIINDSDEMEATLFHEIIHYIFDNCFHLPGVTSYLPHLVESTAKYFENIFYPNNDRLNIYSLMYDRYNECEFAPGCYFIDHLHHYYPKGFNYILNRATDRDSKLKKDMIIRDMIDSEEKNANDMIRESINIILLDMRETYRPKGYGIIHKSNEMNAPFIARLDSDDIQKIESKKDNKIITMEDTDTSIWESNLGEKKLQYIFPENYELVSQLYAEYYRKFNCRL